MVQSSWDKRWMDLCGFIAEWSKDRSRKVGAVIIGEGQTLLSLGWNGFPRGIDDTREELHERPKKYKWTEHAERNAIYNAAANGIEVRGSIMYVMWFPCSDCARAIIQSGIKELVCIQPDLSDELWGEDMIETQDMLLEARINVRFTEGKPPARRDLT